MTLISKNPYNGEIISRNEPMDDGAVDDAISQADATFNKWKRSTFEDRSVKLMALARLLKEEKKRLGRLITLEMGKPVQESIAEIEKCAWVCEYYAGNGEKFLQTETIATDASHSYVAYQPLGVILAVMPWNFPFWQVFRFAAPTVMAGNTAILKHASNVQGCAGEIENLFSGAGFPEGLFTNIAVPGSRVARIIDHPLVKAVTLTGSEKAGAEVASRASKQIKKSVLELGGSNPFIILDDADLDLAVEVGIKARMQNGGQSCIAAKRFIIDKKLTGAFIERIITEIDSLKVGDPMEEDTDIGPLSSEGQAKEVEDQVNKSVAQGAKVIRGGKRNHCFYSPTLLTHITPEMPVFQEEVFGPVLSVIEAGDDKEALQLANHSRFGLGATVMTRDKERAGFFIRGLKDGAVFINELVKSDPRLPFGGTGKSGYGRELSKQGILEFVNCKTIYFK
jgi:succinate-semialdehyde dehydrogenase/glutarate-semialdehyde dehydrogenase